MKHRGMIEVESERGERTTFVIRLPFGEAALPNSGGMSESRLLFVHDDPKVLHGMEWMLRPLRTEWQAAFAEGGPSALWGLPNPIVEALACHHSAGGHCDRGFHALTAVHAANDLEQEGETADGAGKRSVIDIDYLSDLGLADRPGEWRKLRDDAGRQESRA